jgi:hypothetical protein
MTRNLANPVAHVCRVCGRPAQIDDLCRRHGGSFGLIIQTEDLPRSMRIALRLMMSGASLTFFLGILTLTLGGSLTGRDDAQSAAKLAGLAMIVLSVVTLVLAMYVSQLRGWAWPAAIGLDAIAGIAAIVLLAATSPASSYNTLVIVALVLPYLLAAGLIVTWRLRLPPSALPHRAPSAPDAPSPA